MARSVADASALFSTMAGFESQAPTSPNSSSRNPVRVGWLGNAGGIWPMDDGLLDQCEQAVFQLHCPAFSIDHCLPPPQLAELWECWMTLRQHALSSGRLLFDDSAKRSLMGEPWCWEIEQGLTVTQSDITAAQATRSSWSETLVTLFERFDVIAAPACQVYPFKAEDGPPRQIASAALDTYHRWLAISLPASLGGLPVISLPISSPSSERTTGIQLMMPAGQDEALLALAESIEPILAA
jgi:amidase